MFRKILSKLTAPFKSAPKRTEPKPAHPQKSHRTGGRDSHPPRHEKGRGQAPAPKPAAPHARPAAHAPHAPRAAAAPKPLPEVPKLNTTFSALGLGDRVAYAVQQKGYET